MTQFLFVTHLTPKAKRSAFRSALNDLYFRALNAQTYPNWKALVLGDEEKQEGKFHYVKLNDLSSEEKTKEISAILERPDVRQLFSESKYVLKLDDDDWINPLILEKTAALDFDLYYDAYHTFVDSSSGVVTQQKRDWVASTCIHRSEHVLREWNGAGASAVGNLLYTDHSKSWHLYYADKKKLESQKYSPVYARVLSPTSITSGGHSQLDEGTMEKYFLYLKTFGEWKKAGTTDFNPNLPALANAWKNFTGRAQQPLASMHVSLAGRIAKRIFGK